MTRGPEDGTGRVPGPETPATGDEQAQAEAFARRVDTLLRGEPRPPAMAADQRALLETATTIRTVAGARASEAERPAETQDRLAATIDAVLGGGGDHAGGAGASAAPVRAPAGGPRARRPDSRDRNDNDDNELSALSARRRALPWVIAAISAAAAIVLAVRTPPAPATPDATSPRQVSTTMPTTLPAAMMSRPSDGLIGAIPRPEAGMARDRLDVIYAARMSGYRVARFAGVPAQSSGVRP